MLNSRTLGGGRLRHCVLDIALILDGKHTTCPSAIIAPLSICLLSGIMLPSLVLSISFGKNAFKTFLNEFFLNSIISVSLGFFGYLTVEEIQPQGS